MFKGSIVDFMEVEAARIIEIGCLIDESRYDVLLERKDISPDVARSLIPSISRLYASQRNYDYNQNEEMWNRNSLGNRLLLNWPSNPIGCSQNEILNEICDYVWNLLNTHWLNPSLSSDCCSDKCRYNLCDQLFDIILREAEDVFEDDLTSHDRLGYIFSYMLMEQKYPILSFSVLLHNDQFSYGSIVRLCANCPRIRGCIAEDMRINENKCPIANATIDRLTHAFDSYNPIESSIILKRQFRMVPVSHHPSGSFMFIKDVSAITGDLIVDALADHTAIIVNHLQKDLVDRDAEAVFGSFKIKVLLKQRIYEPLLNAVLSKMGLSNGFRFFKLNIDKFDDDVMRFFKWLRLILSVSTTEMIQDYLVDVYPINLSGEDFAQRLHGLKEAVNNAIGEFKRDEMQVKITIGVHVWAHKIKERMHDMNQLKAFVNQFAITRIIDHVELDRCFRNEYGLEKQVLCYLYLVAHLTELSKCHSEKHYPLSVFNNVNFGRLIDYCLDNPELSNVHQLLISLGHIILAVSCPFSFINLGLTEYYELSLDFMKMWKSPSDKTVNWVPQQCKTQDCIH
ncbi:hypothetical protein ACOME3_002803 [Neoechinorhynchus agilis]